MRVPESAGPAGEEDVVAHAVFGVENGIHVDCACEGLAGLAGGCVGLVGAADELHFEDCPDGDRNTDCLEIEEFPNNVRDLRTAGTELLGVYGL